MSLNTSLSIATIEIGNINAQLGVVGQNIANANTPDYARQQISQISVAVVGVGEGAVNAPASRAIDIQVQAEVFTQTSDIASLQTQQSALQQIDSVAGPVGSGSDIGSLLAAVQGAFGALEGNPANPTQQQSVVSAASALTGQLNTLSDAVASNRQAAQDAIVGQVDQLNTTLAMVGQLSKQIVDGRAAGQSTADLENQRDGALDTLSHLISVKATVQTNGDVQVITPSGLNLPIHDTGPAFATTAATLAPGVYAPAGGAPAISFNGRDVTAQLSGGQLGGNIILRDRALPTVQATLDEFARTLSARFDAQGLTLFSDATGAVPAASGPPTQAGYVGFAGAIRVNPAVVADPSLVRDGTHSVAGDPAGASAFSPNPAGGPAGFTALITRVLDYALGGQAQDGVAQPAPAVSNLGPSGTLAAGFAAPPDLAGLAAATTAAQAGQSAAVTGQLSSEQAVQTSLQTRLAAGSAVSIDTEMSLMVTLQNAYGANARVMTAVQAMWTQLLQAVQ